MKNQIGVAKMNSKLWEAEIHPDSLTKNKEGVFTFKRGYFYRMDQSVEKYAAAIAKIPGVTVVDSEDHYATWPSSSYFKVKFTMEGTN